MTNHGSIDVDVTIDGVVNGTVQEGSGGGTRNYERLTNKPQINDVELIGNKSFEDLGIKNNVQPDWEQSDSEAEDYVKNKPENLVSDADYVHTDNNFTDADKSAIDNIPTDLADLNDDSSHRTVSDTEKTIWNGKSRVSANPSSTTQTLTAIEIDGVGYSIEGGSGGGAVESVNGKTGVVVLGASDVGALPSDTPLFSGAYADLTGKPTLGTASALNVAASGDASTSEVVKGDDTRLTDSRNAKDVYSWAKESTKPSYAYSEIQNTPTLGTASAKDYVNSVVDGSSDLVTSDAVHDYVDSAISGVYKPSGNKTCAELLPTLLIASNLGNVYNITDSGVTTSDFVEGAGKTIEVGDNVVIVDVGTQNNATYKFDLLSGMVDLSNYIQKSATSGLMKNDGSVDTNSYATTSQIPDITGKADKVTSAVDGNFAGLDSNGNLTDSGHKHSDYLTQHQDISGKADKTAISSVETTDTAVSAHAVGSYFINASGQFVKTTSAIAIGDTIIVKPTVGYNCEATTITGVIEALNSKTISLTSRTRRNITTDLANLSQAVSEQNLEKYGYKIGDYFERTSGGRTYTYILADLNTYRGEYSPFNITTNHLGIVVSTHVKHAWHSGSAASVGYGGSTLRTYLLNDVLNNIKTDMIALFGGTTGLEHLLYQTKVLTVAFDTVGVKATQYISSLTESQLSGHTVYSGNNLQESEAIRQLEVFRNYNWAEIFGNESPWLRNMKSGTEAAYASRAGYLGADSVTAEAFVVSLICFH